MEIIGREKEIELLNDLYHAKQSDLIAIYGRRRVGKTFLVNSVFDGLYSFKHTGLSPLELKTNESALKQQLNHFYDSLKLYGMKENKKPKDWLEAFFMLKKLLLSKNTGEKEVVFLDELPWMDTPKSQFLSSFESFWNGWADTRNIIVIVCGSANSWIQNKLINNHGGLYNRVTKEILLSPFSLRECELFLKSKNIVFSRYDIVQAYMTIGGIPYYLNYLKRNMSLPQQIDDLFFKNNAVLKLEFDRLFDSAFQSPDIVKKVVIALSKKQIGLTREEICKNLNMKDGETISKVLDALLSSGFIIKYTPLYEGKMKMRYKLIDPFSLFYLKFVENATTLDNDLFKNNFSSQKVTTYKGLAFEYVCFNHISQIKQALNILGVSSNQSTFIYKGNEENKGTQIDLIVERNDNIVNLCEIKFYGTEYVNNKASHLNLIEKNDVLSQFLKKKQSIQNVLITTYGIKNNEYRWDYSNVITLDDLFID